MTDPVPIRSRDRDAILRSLRAGVVPSRGLQHVQVGRANEIGALISDLEAIERGSSTIRFVIGEYGSGKTFFLHLVRSIALEKGMVTAHADLTPDRRLHSTGGHARTLFAELMRNLATRTKPDGGALPSIVERFITSALRTSEEEDRAVELVIQDKLEEISELVGGYDFAQVLSAYWRGHDSGNETLKSDAIRWLRAEFSTKTDAKNALGVRSIIDDENVYDHFKLMARFVRLAGYEGLMICFDEMVNLYKLANTRARTTNYEQILRILNDTLQGTAVGIGFIMCGTPEFLSDPRRGLYSYQALETRLQENRFASEGRVDLSGPVIRLASLTPEDLYVLLDKIRNVFATGDPEQHLVEDEALKAFMEHCSTRIGEAYFRTPRSTIREFVSLLSVLEQNQGADWRELLGRVELAEDVDPDTGAPIGEADEDDDELASFQL